MDHKDYLNQPVNTDSIVAFTWSQGTGVHIGRVVKLTAKKVRIEFKHTYTHNSEIRTFTGRHITDSTNLLVLNNNLEQELTVAALKGLLP